VCVVPTLCPVFKLESKYPSAAGSVVADSLDTKHIGVSVTPSGSVEPSVGPSSVAPSAASAVGSASAGSAKAAGVSFGPASHFSGLTRQVTGLNLNRPGVSGLPTSVLGLSRPALPPWVRGLPTRASTGSFVPDVKGSQTTPGIIGQNPPSLSTPPPTATPSSGTPSVPTPQRPVPVGSGSGKYYDPFSRSVKSGPLPSWFTGTGAPHGVPDGLRASVKRGLVHGSSGGAASDDSDDEQTRSDPGDDARSVGARSDDSAGEDYAAFMEDLMQRVDALVASAGVISAVATAWAKSAGIAVDFSAAVAMVSGGSPAVPVPSAPSTTAAVPLSQTPDSSVMSTPLTTPDKSGAQPMKL